MEAVLEAVKRDRFGKNEAGRLRREGFVPSVFYGGQRGEDGKPVAMPICVQPKALMRILHSEAGANTLITLKVGDLSTKVLLKEYQLDPITHHLLHADFYQVAMDKMIKVTVPIVLRGEAPGVKQQGGLLDFVNREIEIECLPGDIPENIEVDVSGLMLNQAIRLREIVEAVKWKPVTEADLMIAHVVAPKAEVAATPEGEATTTAEPEVIKKGKADKDEEAEGKK